MKDATFIRRAVYPVSNSVKTESTAGVSLDQRRNPGTIAKRRIVKTFNCRSAFLSKIGNHRGSWRHATDFIPISEGRAGKIPLFLSFTRYVSLYVIAICTYDFYFHSNFSRLILLFAISYHSHIYFKLTAK